MQDGLNANRVIINNLQKMRNLFFYGTHFFWITSKLVGS